MVYITNPSFYMVLAEIKIAYLPQWEWVQQRVEQSVSCDSLDLLFHQIWAVSPVVGSSSSSFVLWGSVSLRYESETGFQRREIEEQTQHLGSFTHIPHILSSLVCERGGGAGSLDGLESWHSLLRRSQTAAFFQSLYVFVLHSEGWDLFRL